MSKRKIVIIIIFIIVIIIGLVVGFCLFKPKPEVLTLYGEYSEIKTTNKNTVYQKSYLMMDCCEEWKDLYKDMLEIDNLTAVEGYEIYLFDENGNRTEGENTYTFIPTDEFKEHTEEHDKDSEGKYDIYHWTEENGLELISENNSSFEITSEYQGIFVIAYTEKKQDDDKPFVSNPNCNGQCRACE